MVKLRACIFGSVVDLHWAHKHTRNYEAVDKFLEIIIFKKDYYILHFFPWTACFEIDIAMNCYCVACIFGSFWHLC